MTPYYEAAGITIYLGDCRVVLPQLDLAGVAVVVADPPYGETSLDWDVPVRDWLPLVEPVGYLWCFGSLRMWGTQWRAFAARWTYSQDIVWEKHNGSGFHADRFRRVHEQAVLWYRGPWGSRYHVPVTTPSVRKREVRRKQRPAHTGEIANSRYTSEDGGPLLMRSVIYARSCHGEAIHPTQKPVEIVGPMVEYACPPGGLVLDPCAGSGTTLRVCKDRGRRAIGIELDEAMCEKAARRLDQEVLAL
jgi:site-specific DNA-methyltransferase (adenine-specific)